jgi:hypothetical protein
MYKSHTMQDWKDADFYAHIPPTEKETTEYGCPKDDHEPWIGLKPLNMDAPKLTMNHGLALTTEYECPNITMNHRLALNH